MSRINSQRNSCKDVFNSFLVSDALYVGEYEFPFIKSTTVTPKRLIAFSKVLSCKDYQQWVHFYEDDFLFERIWNNPHKYLEILKRFEGVILPDFSLYRDMPLAMQLWNIYRSRAIGNWFQHNGITVIPNIRYGGCRTYRICCDGIEPGGVIALGSHGIMKHLSDRTVFLNGIDTVVESLQPTTIIIYGTFPKSLIDKYAARGLQIISFQSEYAASHKEVV